MTSSIHHSENEFEQILANIHQQSKHYPKDIRIRIDRWCKKLNEKTPNVLWKKNIKVYAQCFLQMLITNDIRPPFDKLPTSEPLGIPPTFHVKNTPSSSSLQYYKNVKEIEKQRKEMEKQRKEFEKQREEMEEKQIDLEKQRIDLEKQRIDLEKQRIDLEKQRQQVERQRIDLEKQRNDLEDWQQQQQCNVIKMSLQKESVRIDKQQQSEFKNQPTSFKLKSKTDFGLDQFPSTKHDSTTKEHHEKHIEVVENLNCFNMNQTKGYRDNEESMNMTNTKNLKDTINPIDYKEAKYEEEPQVDTFLDYIDNFLKETAVLTKSYD